MHWIYLKSGGYYGTHLTLFIRNGWLGMLMEDLNVCYKVDQSTSPYSLMDDPKLQAWEQFEVEISKVIYRSGFMGWFLDHNSICAI